MPTYSFDIDGKNHSFTTDQALSDEELTAAIGQLSSPSETTAKTAPPPGVPPRPEDQKYETKTPTTAQKVFGTDIPSSPGGFIGDVANSAAWEANRAFAGVGQLAEGGINYLGSKLGVPPDKQTHVFTEMGDWATRGANESAAKDRLAGGLGATVPMAVGGAAVPAAGAATATGRVAQAAGAGALAGATQPVPSGEDLARGKAINMAEGAVLSGGLTALGEGASKIKNKASEILFGHTGDVDSPVRALAKRAEEMGFKINPQQRRTDDQRLQTAGLSFADREQNTITANKIASAATGKEANKITPEYLGERFKDLGAQYDEIYAPGKSYKIDASVIPGLREMVAGEQEARRPFASGPAIQAANRILSAFDAAQGANTARISAMKVDATDLQRVRNQVNALAYKTQDPYKRAALYDVTKAIDASVEKNNPEVSSALNELKPKYRALKTLDNLAKSGAIDANGNISPARVGEYLKNKRNDPGYTKDESTHPLEELGRVGEVFGIRGMNEANVIGGGSTARAKPEDVASHTGRIRMAMEHARELPGVKQALQTGYENKIYSMTGYGLTQDELKAINATMNTMQAEEKKREAANR
jgi:hypothetical protein